MSETKYHVEVKRDDKWYSIAQSLTFERAHDIAERYLPKIEVRIRHVVRTVIWENGKRYGKVSEQSCSQTKTT